MENIVSGQRVLFTVDVFKTVKIKDGDKEQEIQRMYQLVLPYGVPFEEVYEAINVMTDEVKKLEEANKERAKQIAEEQAKQAEQPSVEQPSTEQSSTDMDGVTIEE